MWLEDPLNFVKIENPFGFFQTNNLLTLKYLKHKVGDPLWFLSVLEFHFKFWQSIFYDSGLTFNKIGLCPSWFLKIWKRKKKKRSVKV